MTTRLASRSSSAVSAAVIGVTSPPGTAGAATLPPSEPKPPAITPRKLRFIARHMIELRIAPEEPTSAPVTISRSFESMKPVAAAAQPE